MIKVILLDIDGTLTNDRKQITPKTRSALIEAQKKGCRLVIASGRPPRGLLRFAKELEMDKNHGIFIAYNGGQALDCQSGEVYWDQAMSPEEVKSVLRHLKGFKVQPMIAHERHMYVYDAYAGMVNTSTGLRNIIEYEAHNNNYLIAEEDLLSFVDFPVNKILTLGDPDYLQAHYMEMRAPFEGKLTSMFTAPFYYEYTANGVDKSRAMKESLIKLGYTPEEMIAFGDAENDLTMIRFAGIGVAMGNSVPALKEAADEVTADNNNDGIAESLYRHVL